MNQIGIWSTTNKLNKSKTDNRNKYYDDTCKKHIQKTSLYIKIKRTHLSIFTLTT